MLLKIHLKNCNIVSVYIVVIFLAVSHSATSLFLIPSAAASWWRCWADTFPCLLQTNNFASTYRQAHERILTDSPFICNISSTTEWTIQLLLETQKGFFCVCVNCKIHSLTSSLHFSRFLWGFIISYLSVFEHTSFPSSPQKNPNHQTLIFNLPQNHCLNKRKFKSQLSNYIFGKLNISVISNYAFNCITFKIFDLISVSDLITFHYSMTSYCPPLWPFDAV